jgi:hypothetical protein
MMKSFEIRVLARYYDDEMGEACCTHREEKREERRERCTEFWPQNLKERDHLDDLGVEGKVVLKLILQK